MTLTGKWTQEERIAVVTAAALIARAHSMSGSPKIFGIPNFESILVVLLIKPEFLSDPRQITDCQRLIDTARVTNLLPLMKQQLEAFGQKYPGAPKQNDWLA